MVKKEMSGSVLVEFEFPVERGKIKEFAKAVCDPNPAYTDREHARGLGFPDVLMPVTYPIAFAHHMPSDNFVLEMTEKLGMNVATSVHGETEIIHYRPVCAGEVLKGEVVIGRIYEKEGKRGGTMTFVEMDARYYGEDGELAVLCRNVFIERAIPDALN
ncbi:MAG: MaoC family dehydratase N-terminal domain-containing protein [Proteobacteria bacterium]|nr:MaoC family dehydratase N-terminal domain-containing protein [Pseudomonadota bacterium]